MIENIQSICINTAYACAAGVGVAVAAYIVARGAKVVSGGVKCVTAGALAGALIIGGMVVTNTRYAAAKTNDTQQVGGDLSNTNDVGQLEGGTNGVSQTGGPRSVAAGFGGRLGGGRPRQSAALPVNAVTDEDISNQWRVVSVSSNTLNASVFTYPVTSASFEHSNIETFEHSPAIWTEALANGAGYGSWRIPFGGWRFTFGEVVWTNAFLWCEGYFRSAFANRSNEIQLLNERLTLCPQVNWSRYNLVASRAWAATNDVGGLIATFEGAAINDDPSKIVNAQFELFPQDGRIALRYDLRTVGDALYTAGVVANGTNHFVTVGSNTSEVVFQRVHPDDWDMDGLPNVIDDNPRVPSQNSGCNQTDTWAAVAFPSNATEIVSVGYTAWATARAADPNRRLIGLAVASENGAWPICLSFGKTAVMCDGSEEILFAIDCGARYSFSLSDGELAFVELHGGNGERSSCAAYSYPHEIFAGDVAIHLDSP